jgi:hypothetical protein
MRMGLLKVSQRAQSLRKGHKGFASFAFPFFVFFAIQQFLFTSITKRTSVPLLCQDELQQQLNRIPSADLIKKSC